MRREEGGEKGGMGREEGGEKGGVGREEGGEKGGVGREEGGEKGGVGREEGGEKGGVGREEVGTEERFKEKEMAKGVKGEGCWGGREGNRAFEEWSHTSYQFGSLSLISHHPCVSVTAACNCFRGKQLNIGIFW